MRSALLIDIDGTLLDTIDAILEAMNLAGADLDVGPPFRPDELRPMIGTPVQRQLRELRSISGPRADVFADRYYEHFTRIVDRGVRPYPGVRETLPALADRPITTMSTRRRREAAHMLRVAGLDSYFQTIVGGDDVSRPKPHPDLPLLGAKALRVPGARCVVVGDSPVDVAAGRAAGMRTLAVTYGYGDRVALRDARPDGMVERFDHLPRALADLEAEA
jgi:HAD superfamily hydrolase (TIGR01509 family)